MGMKTKKFVRKDSKRPKKKIRSGYELALINMGAHHRLNTPEWKAVTLNSVLTIPGNDLTWSTVQLINGITQGVVSSGRIGRKVTVGSVQVRWHYSFPLSATDNRWGPWRWMLVYDSSPDGVLPTPSLILDDNSFLGNINLNNSERFAILHDEVVPGTTAGYMPLSGTLGSSGFAGKFYRKFSRGLEMHFSATLGTIADIQKGAIYIMFCNSNSVSGSASSSFYFNARTRFTDV